MTDLDFALSAMVGPVLRAHSLPWRVEQDWTWEVLAADGACIAKCKTAGAAQCIVAEAERLHAVYSAPDPLDEKPRQRFKRIPCPECRGHKTGCGCTTCAGHGSILALSGARKQPKGGIEP